MGPLYHDSFERLFSQSDPFGPIDHADFHYSDPLTVDVCKFVPPLRDPIMNRCSIIMGRRGSGKSTYISTFEMGDALKAKIRTQSISSARALNNQTVVPLKTWKLFAQIVSYLKQVEETHKMQPHLLPPEQVEECWVELIWETIIEEVYERLVDSGQSSCQGVRKYFEAGTPRQHDSAYGSRTTRSTKIKQIKEAAIKDVVNYFVQRRCRVVISLDNFEKYPVRTPEYQAAIQGFLRAITHFHKSMPEHSDSVMIVFALPEEIESTFKSIDPSYTNVLKDTQRSARIRWSPSHLWTVALHRYRLFMQHKDPTAYRKAQDIDISKKNGRKAFLDLIFPGVVSNRLGGLEAPENYIIRHTQLLPRHLLALLNAIVGPHFAVTGDAFGVSPQQVFSGVNEREEYVAEDVLLPYTWVYPEMMRSLGQVLSELEVCFSFGDLDKRLSRFRVDSGAPFDLGDRSQIWRELFNMGVIGVQGESDPDRGYINGMFHFNTQNPERHFAASKSHYCFHPIFARHFGVFRETPGALCIFPSGVDSLGADD